MLDVALADFDRALAIDSELAGAYDDRGQAYELKGEGDKAIADYRKALSLKSKQLYDDKAKAAARKRLTTLDALASPEGARPQPQASDREVKQLSPPDKLISSP